MKTKLTITIENDLKERGEEAAKRADITFSNLVEVLLKGFLAVEEKDHLEFVPEPRTNLFKDLLTEIEKDIVNKKSRS